MTKHPVNDYAAALEFLFSLPDWERKSGPRPTRQELLLERPAALLARLHNPQAHYASVLIAGTKGKGSTAAMLESILRAAGYKTGLYTQPHLHTYRERIRIGGQILSRGDFARGVERLRPILDALHDAHPEYESFTTFEVMTALALDEFARQGVQVAVLEVGMGGRLDATNVVKADLSVITPISFDHTAILGAELDQIAREKAGIIKHGKPILSAPQPAAAQAVIEQVAHAQKAPLGLGERDWLWLGDHANFMVAGMPREGLWGEHWQYSGLRVPLLGVHQLTNAATAVAATHALRTKLTIRPDHVRAGLETTRWPGRLEIIQAADPARPCMVADGAHNGASAAQLAAALRFHFSFERLWLVLGVLEDKDLAAIAAPFVRWVEHAFVVRTRHPRSRAAESIVRELEACGISATATVNTRAALERARRAASPRDLICVTGSLSVVAEARKALGLVAPDEREQEPGHL